VEYTATVEKGGGPRHLDGDVHEVARHRVMLAVGKVGLEVEVTRRTGVGQHRAAVLEAGGRQGDHVPVDEAGELRALHHEHRGLVGRGYICGPNDLPRTGANPDIDSDRSIAGKVDLYTVAPGSTLPFSLLLLFFHSFLPSFLFSVLYPLALHLPPTSNVLSLSLSLSLSLYIYICVHV
jgi:hypothetical protein